MKSNVKYVEPELVDPERDKLIGRMEKLSTLLDNRLSLPGTNMHFGLDAILGLVPGIGDSLGAALSFYILYTAGRLGISKKTLVLMSTNIAIDTLVGLIPVLGDLFDVAWQANKKNLDLVMQEISAKSLKPRRDREIGKGLALILAATFLFLIAVTTYLFILIIKAIF